MKKLICFISLALLLGPVTSASAEVTNEWTGAAGDRDWTNAANWSLGTVPGSGAQVEEHALINGVNQGYPAGPKIVTGQSVTTGDWDTWGPEWGIGVEIWGGTLTGTGVAAPWVGLNIEGDLANPAYGWLGIDDSGGTIDIHNFLVGDTWWWHDGGIGASYEQVSGTCIANDYIWLGGQMDLIGGYTRAENGFSMASVSQANTQCTLSIWAGNSGGKLSLPGGTWYVPRLDADSDTITEVNWWINNGYLVALSPSGSPGGYHINIDTEEEPGRVVLTSVPEPATMAILGLGSLVVLRRRKR